MGQSEPKLVDGKMVYACQHGFTSWQYCGSCCAGLAGMVPFLLRDLERLESEKAAETTNLKERIKYFREMVRIWDASDPWPEMMAATDLRRKNWKKI